MPPFKTDSLKTQAGSSQLPQPGRQPWISDARLIRKNALIGSFTLHLASGLVIRCLLMESHGKRWINFPSEPYQRSDGTKGWLPFARFEPREVSARFQSLVLPLAEAAFGLEASDVA